MNISLIKTPRLSIYISDAQIVDHIEANLETSGMKKLVQKLPEEKRRGLVPSMQDIIDLYKVVDALTDRENAAYFEARESDRPIGYVALKKHDSEMPEIQIALLPTYQHQGYGFEFLTAVLKHMLNERPNLKFVYRAGPYNSASIALVEKIGGILQHAKSEIEGYFFKTYLIDPTHLHWN